MKIGLAGAHSVGKTTLLNALRSESCFKHYKVCDEVTRQVRAMGLNINEGGDDKTQHMIMLKHLENVFMNNNMITDRTALDCLVYTRYLWKNGKVTDTTSRYINEMFSKIWHCYDIVFYIEPEFDMEDDGVRSTDITFRDDIVEEFKQAIAELQLHKDSFFYLTGSVVNRVNRVKEIYEGMQYGGYGKI